MTTKIKFNASELNRLRVCPASYWESKDKPNYTDTYAAIGKAFHKAMAVAASSGRQRVPVSTIAAEYGVSLSELRDLLDRFTFDPEGAEAEIRIAVEYDEFYVSGRLDYRLAQPSGNVDIVDYKVTHLVEEEPEPETNLQLKAYAVGSYKRDDEKVTGVTVSLAMVRRGDYGWSEPYHMDEGAIDDAYEEIREVCASAIVQGSIPKERRKYTLSHHCTYCPGRSTCPAASNELRQAMALVKGKTVDIELTLENALKMFMVARLADRASTALKGGIKELVRDVGPISVEEPGKVLDLRTQFRKPNLREEMVESALADAAREAMLQVDEWCSQVEDQEQVAQAKALCEAILGSVQRSVMVELSGREKVPVQVLNLYAEAK